MGIDMEAGKRLLHYDPDDYDVIISNLYVLRIGVNKAETTTAFDSVIAC